MLRLITVHTTYTVSTKSRFGQGKYTHTFYEEACHVLILHPFLSALTSDEILTNPPPGIICLHLALRLRLLLTI